MAVDFRGLAGDIVDGVGGKENIRSATHCATRLRMVLRDEGKANTDGVKALDGVMTVVQAGGQYQVVIGNDVPLVYAELNQLIGGGDAAAQAEDDDGPKGNIIDRFIALVSSIFQPILWPLAGAGLFKAFLQLFVTLGWLNAETTGNSPTTLEQAASAEKVRARVTLSSTRPSSATSVCRKLAFAITSSVHRAPGLTRTPPVKSIRSASSRG